MSLLCKFSELFNVFGSSEYINSLLESEDVRDECDFSLLELLLDELDGKFH